MLSDWGQGPDDRSRALLIDRNRPRGGAVETTKSGRERRVPLSRRLRAALREIYIKLGRPGPQERILGHLLDHNFHSRRWHPLCRTVGLEGYTPKDLRDTFASWLVSLGAPLPFVQAALGHSNWAVTAEHYARWVPEVDGMEAPRLQPGEVWPDLLARVMEEDSPRHVRAESSLTRF